MDLSLGFLFCSIDLYFCLCASTILSWWLWLCSIVCHLFLIPSASVRSIPFLSLIVPIFAWNVPLISLRVNNFRVSLCCDNVCCGSQYGNGRISLSFYGWIILHGMSNTHTHTHTHLLNIFFTHSSFGGYLCCFHMWAIVSKAAMNMEVLISSQSLVSFPSVNWWIPAGPFGSSIFNILRNLVCSFPWWLHPH